MVKRDSTPWSVVPFWQCFLFQQLWGLICNGKIIKLFASSSLPLNFLRFQLQNFEGAVDFNQRLYLFRFFNTSHLARGHISHVLEWKVWQGGFFRKKGFLRGVFYSLSVDPSIFLRLTPRHLLIREIGQMRSLWLGLFPPNVMESRGLRDLVKNYMSEKRANAVNLQNISTHKRAFRVDVCTMPLRVHVYVQSYLQSKLGLRHRRAVQDEFLLSEEK